ncbi:MAG: hypothetical protein GX986_02425 [Firmicutes bacterium]|nr:hypothetical protein [Bacillota bacterium]
MPVGAQNTIGSFCYSLGEHGAGGFLLAAVMMEGSFWLLVEILLACVVDVHG